MSKTKKKKRKKNKLFKIAASIAGVITFIISLIMFIPSANQMYKNYMINHYTISISINDSQGDAMYGKNIVCLDDDTNIKQFRIDNFLPLEIKTNYEDKIQQLSVYVPNFNGKLQRVNIAEEYSESDEYYDETYGSKNACYTKIFIKNQNNKEIIENEEKFSRSTLKECQKLEKFYIAIIPEVRVNGVKPIFHSKCGYYIVEVVDKFDQQHLFLITYLWINNQMSLQNLMFFKVYDGEHIAGNGVSDSHWVDVITDNIDAICMVPGIKENLLNEEKNGCFNNSLTQLIDINTYQVKPEAVDFFMAEIAENFSKIKK